MRNDRKNLQRQTAFTAILTFLVTLGALNSIETVNPVADTVTMSAPVAQSVRDIIEIKEFEQAPEARIISLEEKIASGCARQNEYGWADWSSANDGTVTVCWTAIAEDNIKCTVTGPTTSYAYDVDPGKPIDLTLTDGNGSYDVCLLQHLEGTRYQVMMKAQFTASLEDPMSPYLGSNPFVNWEDAPKTVQKAEELTAGMSDDLEKIIAIYSYVKDNITYDRRKAETADPGYLTDLDQILDSGTGICLDYAALCAGMMRSQDIPCKLVIGYAGSDYHAWISVWSEESGWVDDGLWFQSNSWGRMDPTFAASAKTYPEVLEYIGDGTNYRPERNY